MPLSPLEVCFEISQLLLFQLNFLFALLEALVHALIEGFHFVDSKLFDSLVSFFAIRELKDVFRELVSVEAERLNLSLQLNPVSLVLFHIHHVSVHRGLRPGVLN